MTGFSPYVSRGFPALPSSQPGLTPGAHVEAEILAPTRHGVGVRINGQMFVLSPQSKLPDTGIVTINVMERMPDGQRKVQVVALNGQGLNPPIAADIAARTTGSSAETNPATIKIGHQIDVGFRLLSPEGQPYGPALQAKVSLATGSESQRPALTAGVPTISRDASSFAHAPAVPQSEHARPNPDVLLQKLGEGTAPGGSRDMASQQGLALSTSTTPSNLVGKLTSLPESMMVTVVGHAADAGSLVLSTDHGDLFQTDVPLDLPVNTRLRLALKPFNLPQNQVQPAHQQGALAQLITILEDLEQPRPAGGAPGQASAKSQLPEPNRDLAARFIHLMNLQTDALSHDAEVSPRGQETGAASKSSSLQQLLSDIAQTMGEQIEEGWRATSLPLSSDPTQAVGIYFREQAMTNSDDEEQNDHDQGDIQRAIFDVTFQNLGRCQIDVLCQDQRFDLLIRSERGFRPTDQQALTDLFVSTCEITGLQGDISYRQGGFFELIRREEQPHAITT